VSQGGRGIKGGCVVGGTLKSDHAEVGEKRRSLEMDLGGTRGRFGEVGEKNFEGYVAMRRSPSREAPMGKGSVE